MIADNLSKAGWSWGCSSETDSTGRTIWIGDAPREDGKRFVVHADEKLTAFLEIESAIRAATKRLVRFIPYKATSYTSIRNRMPLIVLLN